MYGSVLSGGLAGHIYGTGAYCGNTTGEPKHEGDRPYIWEGLNYVSGSQLPYLARFILSEEMAYQYCSPQREKLKPNETKDSKEKGLDGWSFMLLSDNKDLAFLYFEHKAEPPSISGLKPNKTYDLHWFDPINGEWLKNTGSKLTNGNGVIEIDRLPTNENVLYSDWCLKLKLTE
jgi:hypothetical protein